MRGYAQLRQRRKTAEDLGRCTICTVHPASPGMKTCDRCRNVSAASKERAITTSLDWCVACQASEFHRDGCPGDNGSGDER